jgi:hypothetical protein
MAHGYVILINIFSGGCQGGNRPKEKMAGLEVPVQLRAEFVFELAQAIVTEKNHSGVAVILDGQVAPERLKPAALDAIKIGFGGEGGADDLLPDVPGVNDRVEKLTFIGLHTPIPHLSPRVSSFLWFFLFLQQDIPDHFLKLQPLVSGEQDGDPPVGHAQGNVVLFGIDPDFVFLVAVQQGDIRCFHSTQPSGNLLWGSS